MFEERLEFLDVLGFLERLQSVVFFRPNLGPIETIPKLCPMYPPYPRSGRSQALDHAFHDDNDAHDDDFQSNLFWGITFNVSTSPIRGTTL